MAGFVETDLGSVISAAVEGDETAFARIVATHDSEMYRVCVAVCRDQAVAAEAVQSAWAIAWRKLGSVRQPDRLRPWLVSIAVNESKKLLKKQQRRSRVETGIEAAADHGRVDRGTGVASLDLRVALERLDPDERALLAMRYVAGFNATELSTALGISPSGTRTRLERLVARLRQELE